LAFNLEVGGALLIFGLQQFEKKGSTMKYLCIPIMMILLILPPEIFAGDDSLGASVSVFKAQSLYRAVKLNWRVKTPFKNEVSFQILRSDTFVEGPYEEIATVPYDKRKGKYIYLDKSLGSESKYYYKLVVKGADETYGPIPARPYFSPPAT
jgi:hypothetical protein